MSLTVGQLFGAAIGAAVAVIFPPAAGLTYAYFSAAVSIGMSIGGIIDPPTGQTIKQEGPRIGDLSGQTSEWGAPIRRLFGTYRLSGNVIWSLPLHETKHVEESGEGKGGGGTKTETTWYSYAGSWAVGLCEGEVQLVKKIWFDSVLVYDGTNYSGGLSESNKTIYLGTQSQPIDWYMQATNPDTPAYRNLCYIVFNKIELENYGNKIPSVSVELQESISPTIAEISEKLLKRTGLISSNFDVSGGTDQTHGYVIPNPMNTRSAITTLLTAYNFDLIESEFQIKLKKRGTDPVITINDSDIIDFVEIDRIQTVELSKTISILYANKDKNYDAGIQSATRINSDAKAVKAYQYALALSDTEAKRISEMYLYSEWNERLEFKLTVSRKYLYLEPATVIQIDYKGKLYTIRITKIDFVTNGQLYIEASQELKTIYDSIAIGSSTNNAETITTVQLQGDTNFELLDVPMLDNLYNGEGIYIAANGILDGWKGCNISKSIDLGVTYNSTGRIINGTLLGETTTKLLFGKHTVMDKENSVTVELIGNLYSISHEDLLNANNYILIGDEILQYANAVDNEDGTFTLSSLLRGRRGTEWALNTHFIGDRFVFLDTNMIFDSTASLNVASQYKATTFDAFIEDSIPKNILPEIRCLKPLSPSYVKGIRDVNNNLTITWMRRSRDVTGYLKKLQLFEETEEYQIIIVDADTETFYTSSVESFAYSDADQLADNSSHVSGDPVNIVVYQMSGIVQRGYGTEATV